MAWVAIVISVSTFVLSVAGFVFTLVRMRREQTDRARQFALMQEQFEAAAADRKAQGRATLSAELLAFRPAEGEIPVDEIVLRITNAGPAIARGVKVWLRSGNTSAFSNEDIPPMMKGDHRTLTISAHHRLRYSQQPVVVMAEWLDESGNREEEILELGDLG